MFNFNYFIPCRVLFGKGKLEELATTKLPGKKALICTTAGKSMQKSGTLARVISLLQSNGVDCILYDKVSSNPNTHMVMEAAALGKEHHCDFVIGLGGGSSIDTAKMVAVIMANGGEVWDYMGGMTGKSVTVDKALPIVVISTTSGTGSEVNPFSVITKEETFEKIDLGSEAIYPTMVIVDPELQVGIPPALTAYQGMDVIFHSAEGYVCNCTTPISDLFALESIRLAAKYLPRAFRNGNDLEAREGMCLANLFAGLVESTSACTSEHAIAHSLGAMHPTIPHGAALSLVCVECFRYYAQWVPERLADMAMCVGYGDTAEDFVRFLQDILTELDLSQIDYTKWGIRPEWAEKYAQNSYDVTQCLHDADVHPVPLEDCIDIIRKSLL